MTHQVVYRKSTDPYMGTEVSFERSLQQISTMLEKYQVEDLITRKTLQVLQGCGLKDPVTFYTLAFRKAGLNFIIEFPIIIQRGPVRGNYEDQSKRKLKMDASARIIHDRLKALLIQVELGVSDFNAAMMPYVALPDGRGGLESLHDFDGIMGVIGGPPCQGSSLINTRRCPDDPRNELMGEFMRIVEEIKPRFFVMENVPHVPKERKGEVQFRGRMAGYGIVSCYLNAADYGAAQTRKRWIVVGIRGKKWTPPTVIPSLTVRQAFAQLSGNWGLMKCNEGTLQTLTRATGEWTAMSGKFKNMIKLSWNRPAPAVVNLKKVYMVHPGENRNISLAEAAALQGFPPGYVWRGTESEIAQMIANAMPAQMAYAIAGSI